MGGALASAVPSGPAADLYIHLRWRYKSASLAIFFISHFYIENQANRPAFNAMRRKGAEHPIEEVGKNLRGMMSWMKK